jgi:hypothetical protein
LNLGDDFRAVAIVGDILVEKDRLATFRFHVGFDLERARQRAFQIEMRAKDIEPGVRERAGTRRAKPGRCAENKRPTFSV